MSYGTCDALVSSLGTTGSKHKSGVTKRIFMKKTRKMHEIWKLAMYEQMMPPSRQIPKTNVHYKGRNQTIKSSENMLDRRRSLEG
jgi:hypothetical protein